MNYDLIDPTVQITTAYLSFNAVESDKIPRLIGDIYNALEHAGETEELETELIPAVSKRQAVKPDCVTCLECGKQMKMLKRHLMTDHGLTVEDYRNRWDLGPLFPIMAPNYALVRRDLAKKIGLGRKPGQKRGRKKAA